MNAQTLNEAISTAHKLYINEQYEDCINFIEKTVKKNKSTSKLLANLYLYQARSYNKLEDHDKTIAIINIALKFNTEIDAAYFYLAIAYNKKNKKTDAIKAYKKAIEINPRKPSYFLNLASIYKHLSRLDEACENYELMLKLNPLNAKAYRNLGLCKKYTTENNNDVTYINKILKKRDITSIEKFQCYFALGKIYNDCNNYDKAFESFKKGNKVKNSTLRFNGERFKKKIDLIINTYNDDLFTKIKSFGSSSDTPIFVIDMSRSGKSLAEHLIAQHPDVVAMDEIGCFEVLIDKFLNSQDAPYPFSINNVQENLLKDIATSYLNKTKLFSLGKKLHCIDTTPSNIRHLGLIYLIFPKAKIIYCSRSPLDHCLHIYFKYFVRGNNYAFDLSNIAFFYNESSRMINHWKKHLPMQILDVTYEDLVQKTSETTSKMMEFLNLNYNNNLVRTYKENQPIYDSEINRWKCFEKYLSDLKKELNVN